VVAEAILNPDALELALREFVGYAVNAGEGIQRWPNFSAVLSWWCPGQGKPASLSRGMGLWINRSRLMSPPKKRAKCERCGRAILVVRGWSGRLQRTGELLDSVLCPDG